MVPWYWNGAYIPLRNGYPQGTLNQGIDVPHRYPKMGDWSAIFMSITILGNAHRPCKQLNNITTPSLLFSWFFSLQSPILGYLWGTLIPWFTWRVPHSRVVYELHTNTMVPQNVKPIPYPTHTNTMSHTIPYHTIPYHIIRGVSGPFTRSLPCPG